MLYDIVVLKLHMIQYVYINPYSEMEVQWCAIDAYYNIFFHSDMRLQSYNDTSSFCLITDSMTKMHITFVYVQFQSGSLFFFMFLKF